MRARLGFAGVAALICVSAAVASDLCQSWSSGESLGSLDSGFVSEASGLAASRLIPGRLYHVNDSGGGAFLYVSALDGTGLRRLRLGGVRSVVDPEAVTLGTVNGEPTVFVGDIGDNLLRRNTVEILAIAEREIQSDTAPVGIRVVARYPDGAHNAEAMAMAPGGALYIFTKSWTNARQDPAPSRIYRLSPDVWSHPTREPKTLELIGELDMPALATREKALFSDVVTDAAMTADGSRFLLLTYGYAWEFSLDLRSPIPPASGLERGRDYQLIRLEPLLGKETVAYLPGDRDFLFGKEYKPDSRPSVLIRMSCLD